MTQRKWSKKVVNHILTCGCKASWLIRSIYDVAPALEGQFVAFLDGSIHEVGVRASPAVLSLWHCKNVSYIQV
jgi:hypothetical protein